MAVQHTNKFKSTRASTFLSRSKSTHTRSDFEGVVSSLVLQLDGFTSFKKSDLMTITSCQI